MFVCSDSKTSPERKISVCLYLWTVLASPLKHFVLPVMLFPNMYSELWEHLCKVYSLNFKITFRVWEVMCMFLHLQTFSFIFLKAQLFLSDGPTRCLKQCVCMCVLMQWRKINDCSNNIMISQETKSSQRLSLTQTRSDEQPGQSETQNGNDSSCKQAFYNDGKALSLLCTHTHTNTVQGTNPCTGLGMCANVSLHSSSSLSQSFCYSFNLSIIKTWGLCHWRVFHVFFPPFLFFCQLLTLLVFICSLFVFSFSWHCK